MQHLNLYGPETWLDPDLTDDIQLRLGALNALLHVSQRINLWDDEGSPAFAPFVYGYNCTLTGRDLIPTS